MFDLRHLLFCGVTLLLAACGGSDATSASSPDVVPAGATSVQVTSIGYLPMPNGTCTPTTYTLDLTNNTLTYDYCVQQNEAPPASGKGTKTLTSEQAAPVLTALHAMRVDTDLYHCGDDNADTITFTAPSGDTTLYSMLKHCMDGDTRTFVSGTYDLTGALYTAASTP